MSSKRKSQKSTHVMPCLTLHADDNIDPRYYFRKSSYNRKDRRVYQLCGQVARTLDCIFSGENNEPLLEMLYVGSVEPFPDARRLMVSLALSSSKEQEESVSIEQVLVAVGRLRSYINEELAITLHRKRIPMLHFQVVPGYRMDYQAEEATWSFSEDDFSIEETKFSHQ